MNDLPRKSAHEHGRRLSEEIGARASRKLRSQSRGTPGIWFGLGMMGLVGWSIAIPTLLGAALGIWLDRHYPGPHSWTLALLLAGLVLGCWNAWHWLARQHREIREEENDDE